MDHIVLNNGLNIPCFGFGTYPQKEELENSVKIAYNAGYRMFDIADNYHNEEFLGRAIEASTDQMCDAVVISKFSQPNRTKRLEVCFEESLNKLSNKIDIYLLHWPYPYLWKEQWRRMEKLYLDGKCKGIGVCNFEIDKLKELLSFCQVKPVINQIERHPLFQQKEIVDFCKANDIIVMCYSPMARYDKSLFENEEIIDIARKYNKTVGQIILRWNLETGCIPIPGSKSKEHIVENADILDIHLTNEEMQIIQELDCGKRIRFDPKSRFSFRDKCYFLLYRFCSF